MQHVMLDLETWGTRPGCALRSIGAVSFNLYSAIGDEFYRNIDDDSCGEAGLIYEDSTIAWWKKQSPESVAALAVNPQPLKNVIADFHNWFRDQGGEFIWSHGGNFDEPIWSAAAYIAGQQTPWKFWNARCTRTAYALVGFDPHSITRTGTYHNALDDARYQVQCVQAAMRMLDRGAAA